MVKPKGSPGWDLNVPFDQATTGRYLTWIRRAAFILLVIGICGFLIDGANRPANPKLVPGSGQPSGTGLKGSGAVPHRDPVPVASGEPAVRRLSCLPCGP